MMQPSPPAAGFDRASKLLGEIALAAHVEPLPLEVRPHTRRMGAVERRRDGLHVVLHSATLTAPEPALKALLAHEVAHVARGHLITRARLRDAAVASIWVVAIVVMVGYALLVALGFVWSWWAWLMFLATGFAAMLVPRAVQIAVIRRQEFEADCFTVELLGTAEPLTALFDWLAANTKPLIRPLPVRLWITVHPSTAARREALARAPVHPGHSNSRR